MTPARTASFLLCFLLPFLSCDEELPPRRDPTKLFDAYLETTWLLTNIQNRIYLRLVVRNRYDEIIEGVADIEGTLSFTLARDPTYTRTHKLGWWNVDDVHYFNHATGVMAIPPGDSMSFFIPFDWLDDLGRDFRTGLIYQTDPLCEFRHIAKHEILIVRGEVRLFPRIAKVTAEPLLYELCHVDTWINPKICPPIYGETAGCLELGWGQ